jgi:hypothetical protein
LIHQHSPRSCTRSSSPAASIILAAAFLSLLSTTSRADLVLDVIIMDSTATAGSAGNAFDVILKNSSTGGEATSITAFSLNLGLPVGVTHVTFTGIGVGTSLPYLFGTTGSFDTGPEGTVSAGQVTLNDSSAAFEGQVLEAGDSLGLAHVTYSVGEGAPAGSVLVSLANIGAGTSLTLGPPDFESIPPSPVDGMITIDGTAVVPEPSSSMIVAIAGIVGLAVCGRLRERVRRDGSGRAMRV